MTFPCGRSSRSGDNSSMGIKEPIDALMASTMVLEMEMPTALTLWPNMMAPKPQAKPARQAISAACGEVSRMTRRKSGMVAHTRATGIRTQETGMKTAHRFSHDQRPRYLMGSM